jgi:hypothetical protein
LPLAGSYDSILSHILTKTSCRISSATGSNFTILTMTPNSASE